MGEGSGASSEWVGDAAHAHERFGVLKFVEAAGAAVEWGEEGIKTRFLVPLPSTGAEVGKVFSARAVGAGVGEACVERGVKSVQHKSGVERGECGKGGCPSGVRLGELVEVRADAPRPFTGGGREPSEGVEPRTAPSVGVGCAALWAEAGVGRGSKGEEDVSHYCAFEDGVFVRGREKFLPKRAPRRG